MRKNRKSRDRKPRDRRQDLARRGASAIEYAMVLSIISVVVVIAAQHIDAGIQKAADSIVGATSNAAGQPKDNRSKSKFAAPQKYRKSQLKVER